MLQQFLTVLNYGINVHSDRNLQVSISHLAACVFVPQL